MRVFLGMILGAVLTIAGAYTIDAMHTSSTAAGPAAVTNRPMVNWDVVQTNWQQFKTSAKDGWDKLSARVDRG
jgi:hypothetical protein